MKPVFAGSIDEKEIYDAWKIALFNDLTNIKLSMGEVESIAPTIASRMVDAMPSVKRVLNNAGFKAIDNGRLRLFPKTDFTVAHGNAGPHSDDGLGMAALVLLKVTPFCKSDPETVTCPSVSLTSCYATDNLLWTSHGLTMVREGDVVVFDGNKEHAWFCSGRAHFVTVLVTKKRKQKGDIVGLPVPRK